MTMIIGFLIGALVPLFLLKRWLYSRRGSTIACSRYVSNTFRPGDRVVFGGQVRTVIAVTETSITLAPPLH